jgi:hypothetical protein
MRTGLLGPASQEVFCSCPQEESLALSVLKNEISV